MNVHTQKKENDKLSLDTKIQFSIETFSIFPVFQSIVQFTSSADHMNSKKFSLMQVYY